MLKNTTIITGGDSHVIDQIINCIESIRNTQNFKNVNIEILDAGLNDEHVRILRNNYQVSNFIDAKKLICQYIDFDNIPNLDETLKKENGKFLILTAQALLGYKVRSPLFVWIEADIWVQDEKTLEELLKLASTQGVGCAEHSSQKTVLESGVYHNWDKLDYEHIKNLKAYAGGLYSADKNHIFTKHLADGIIDTIGKFGYRNAREEGVFSLALYKNQPIKILPTHHHYTPFWAPGAPILNENNEFIHPISKEKIGCLHVTGPWRSVNKGYFCPIQKLSPDGSLQRVFKSFWYRDVQPSIQN